jgi:proteic killer suppression protein
MEVGYQDQRLAAVELGEVEQAAAALKLPIAVIAAYRRKLVAIKAAPDERTLRNWKSLNYKKRDDLGEGHRTIRLNDQFRMLFTINTQQQPNRITVLAIDDLH